MIKVSAKTCERCGKEFIRTYGQSAKQWAGRSYCSRKCGASKLCIDENAVIASYLNGFSSTEIGEKCGMSATHVLRIVKRNKIQTRPASENKKLSHSRQSTLTKLSEAAKGRTHSEATKKKLRAINGAEHPLWRAGLTLGSGGYLQFTSSRANGVHAGRFLHQIIAEWRHGKRPSLGEHVHHVDGNKLNNAPDNLQILTASEHLKLHFIERKTRNNKYA